MSKKEMKTLMIIESPGKIKKLQSFLPSNFVVMASLGHIRNLRRDCYGTLGIDVNDSYKPYYEMDTTHKRIIAEMKKVLKECDRVLLSSDNDLEGHAISEALNEELALDKLKIKTQRAVFTEITKTAVLKAIENAGPLDKNKSDAQKARQILDKLVGWDLSGSIWGFTGNYKLSGGRVQSAALRLIVEQEKLKTQFDSKPYFKIDGIFSTAKPDGKSKNLAIKAALDSDFEDCEEAREFINKCKDSKFTVMEIKSSNGQRKPSPTLTTSSLQQLSSSKLGFSPKRTMSACQLLYEKGHITYHRTDSLTMSVEALNSIKSKITTDFGDEYSNLTQYKTKNDSAAEAHECIRMTHVETESIAGSDDEKKMYKLIYCQTLMSQMSPAKVINKSVKITIDKDKNHYFIAKGEQVVFSGFLEVMNKMKKAKLVKEDTNEDGDEEGVVEEDLSDVFSTLIKGQELFYNNINSKESCSRSPHSRFTEASLIKSLEDKKIGRPSTFASICAVNVERGYVELKDIEGTTYKGININLTYPGKIVESEIDIKKDSDKNKLVPTDIGIVVSEYLNKYFDSVVNYDFTSQVEANLDLIASGKLKWVDVVHETYTKVNEIASKLKKNTDKNERVIGIDPKTGHNVVCLIAKHGPIVCIKHPEDKKQNRYIGISNDKLQNITLEEALPLFKYPYTVDEYNNDPIVVKKGPTGYYLNHGAKNYSLPTEYQKDNACDILTSAICVGIIDAEKAKQQANTGLEYDNGNIKVLNGKFGPYIAYTKNNKRYNIGLPKTANINNVTEQECWDAINKKLPKMQAPIEKTAKEDVGNNKNVKAKPKRAPAKPKAPSKPKAPIKPASEKPMFLD